MDTILNNCLPCESVVTRRQQGLLCEGCNRWQHRTCNSGISQQHYRHAVKNGLSIEWACITCSLEGNQSRRQSLPIVIGNQSRRQSLPIVIDCQ
jgi:hypothetical protein